MRRSHPSGCRGRCRGPRPGRPRSGSGLVREGLAQLEAQETGDWVGLDLRGAGAVRGPGDTGSGVALFEGG